MNAGARLWLRHHRVPAAVVASVVATAVMRVLIGLITADGSDIEVGPLWISAAASLPLVFIFIHETDADRTSPWSLLGRRAALGTIALGVTGVLALACFPTELTGLGFVATWRNCIALLGLGLLSMALMGRRAVWVLPTVVALLSMMFAWPWKPAFHHGIWGALRAPGDLAFEANGVVNLSIPVCLALGALAH